MERNASFRRRISLNIRMMAALLLTFAWYLEVVGAERGVEWCGKDRGEGDKWFDGCQWCVCTLEGPLCSLSTCSPLVDQVPPCHKLGQSWTDGCYRCHCGSQGISCRLDVTCDLLRDRPVPCLADERCVCGPDGVPSCTAEVIDRNAFDARRFRLESFSNVLEPKRGLLESRRVTHNRHGGRDHIMHHHRRSSSSNIRHPDHLRRHHKRHILNDDRESNLPSSLNEGAVSADESAQELLITSDNLCRFGARWYGGSLRCFCDLDGSIACGNPVFVVAFFDDFRAEPELCEEGHAWQDGCRVCTCHVNGVIFCRNDHDCPHYQDNDINLSADYYLRGFPSDFVSGSGEEDSILNPPSPTLSSWLKKEPSSSGCIPGSRWRDGCLHCRCTHHGRQLCSGHQCQENQVDRRWQNADDDQDPFQSLVNQAKVDTGVLMSPFKRGSRGPMMVAPKPKGDYKPPAYAYPRAPPLRMNECGKFKVGEIYWVDCNLCKCTRRGPLCEGKLCV